MDWHKAADCAARIAADWQRGSSPGGAVLIFDRTRIRAEICGGLASVEHGLAFTPDTANRYASVTKHIFCALILKDGKLGLDDPLGRHLPMLGTAPASVSIGRALDMTGGLPDLAETLGHLAIPSTASLGREGMFRTAAAIDALNFPQGSEISYSNTGHRLIQAALEPRIGPMEAAWRDMFFDPLNLDIRFPEDESVPVPRLATGYWQGADGWRRGRYGLHYSPSGGLAGTARDLARWLQALMADRGPAAGLLGHLSPARTLTDGRRTGYGLGLAHAPYFGTPVVGHGGSLPGYRDHFLIAPERGVGVVVLCNREDPDTLGIALRVLAAGLGTPLPAPVAPTLLPDGIFVADTGAPVWVEHSAGRITFLGTQETLFDGGDGWAVSRSPYMWMRLRREGTGIAGEVNHTAWRFVPADMAARPAADWAGTWREPTFGATFEIDVQDGEAHLHRGIGPARISMPLQAIGRDMALGDHTSGPARTRPCLQFSGNTVRMHSNRSRVLAFARIGG